MIDRVYTFPIRKRSARKVASIFGSNIHIKYGNGSAPVNNYPQNWTVQTYVDSARDLGIGWYRTNLNSAADALAYQPYFSAFRAAGVEPFVVIDLDITLTDSFATAYGKAKTIGQQISANLVGYCKYFETSNERDYHCRTDGGNGPTLRTVALNGVADGTYIDGSRPTDYDATKIEAFCGWNAGMEDGIRVNIPDAICGFATGAGFGYVMGSMLHNGTDRNGNVVRTPRPQGLAGSHWYMNMGDPTKAGQSGHVVNVFQQYNQQMPGAAIFVTEWGLAMDETTQSSTIPTWCHTWYSNRVAFNIQGAFIYAHFPNPSGEGTDTATSNWGIYQADGVTKRAGYTAYKNFISNPH